MGIPHIRPEEAAIATKDNDAISAAVRELRPHRSSLSDDVYDVIKHLLMDHVIAPGERAGIDHLARELGVSPTPIREALARLEAEGLVIKEPLKGYRVSPLLTRGEVENLFDFRLRIEPWAAAVAAERATPAYLEAIAREIEIQPEIPNGVRYADYDPLSLHDQRFHNLIVESTENAFTTNAYQGLHVHLHLFRLHYGQELGRTVPVEHREISDAILRRDPDGAHLAMKHHIESSRARLLETFEGDTPSAAGLPS